MLAVHLHRYGVCAVFSHLDRLECECISIYVVNVFKYAMGCGETFKRAR